MSYIEQKAEIDKLIEQFVQTKLNQDNALTRAMCYSLLNGGKRIRPALLLACARALSNNIENAYPLAIAVECIHTYSLIHDDLPAMDNDQMRRGQPTCHIAFGEATAILAGDGLLNLAAEVIFDAYLDSKAQSIIKGGSIIFKGAGALGMVNGQSMEFNASDDFDAQYLHEIHINKTAKMFAVSAASGAIAGGADSALAERFYNFGLNFGLAFQILDDIDDGEQRFSALSFYGLEQCKAKVAHAIEVLNQNILEFQSMGLNLTGIKQIVELLKKE